MDMENLLANECRMQNGNLCTHEVEWCKMGGVAVKARRPTAVIGKPDGGRSWDEEKIFGSRISNGLVWSISSDAGRLEWRSHAERGNKMNLGGIRGEKRLLLDRASRTVLTLCPFEASIV